jgi:hypothetical protein
MGREDRARRALHSLDRGVELIRRDRLAPLDSEVLDVAAEGPTELDPALAELAARGDDDRLARADQVRDPRLHRPAPRGREAEDLVLGTEDLRQALERPGVDLDERGRPVVEDRLSHHLAHRRRQRRRAGGHQVLLDEWVGGFGH